MATFNPECMNGKGGFGCIGSLERPDTFNVRKLSIISYSRPVVCLCIVTFSLFRGASGVGVE
jgi:hypothetical protein